MRRYFVWMILFAAIILGYVYAPEIGHGLLHFFGADNLSGPEYGLWSGVLGSCATNIVAFGIGYWLHNQCHEHRCYRIARHTVTGTDGTVFKACVVHHPNLNHKKPFHFSEHHLTRHHFKKQ